MDDVPPLKQSERVVAHSAVCLVKVNSNDKAKLKMKAPIGPRETCEIAFPINANANNSIVLLKKTSLPGGSTKQLDMSSEFMTAYYDAEKDKSLGLCKSKILGRTVAVEDGASSRRTIKNNESSASDTRLPDLIKSVASSQMLQMREVVEEKKNSNHSSLLSSWHKLADKEKKDIEKEFEFGYGEKKSQKRLPIADDIVDELEKCFVAGILDPKNKYTPERFVEECLKKRPDVLTRAIITNVRVKEFFSSLNSRYKNGLWTHPLLPSRAVQSNNINNNNTSNNNNEIILPPLPTSDALKSFSKQELYKFLASRGVTRISASNKGGLLQRALLLIQADEANNGTDTSSSNAVTALANETTVEKESDEETESESNGVNVFLEEAEEIDMMNYIDEFDKIDDSEDANDGAD